jgi:uncharacterized protein
MGWIKKFAQRHIYVFSFMVALMAIMLLYICNSWLSKSGNRLNYDLYGVLTYLIPLIFVVCVCLFSGNISRIKFHKKGLVEGFFLGWLFLVVGVYNVVMFYLSSNKASLSFPGMEKIIYFTAIMLFIGIFEEILCRGVILNSMLNQWGHTKAGIIKSVALSSLIFGVAHLINLAVYPNLIIRTASQIVFTSLHGFLFASVYLRCKNIWSVVLLHAVYDWLVKFSGLYRQIPISAAPADISVLLGVVNVLFAVPFALVGLFLLRKVLVEDLSKPVANTESV